MAGAQLKLEPIPSTVNKIMSELKTEAHLDAKKAAPVTPVATQPVQPVAQKATAQ